MVSWFDQILYYNIRIENPRKISFLPFLTIWRIFYIIIAKLLVSNLKYIILEGGMIIKACLANTQDI